MKSNRLIPGVVLILIGITFLLRSYGYLNFHFWNLVYLWPIIIVVIGINLIFANKHSAWATAVKLAVIIGGFGLLLFGNYSDRDKFWDARSYRFNLDDNDDDEHIDYVEGNKNGSQAMFNEPYNDSIKVAQLNISGGGTSFKLTDTTSELFNANTQEFYSKYMLKSERKDSVYVLNFKMRNGKERFEWDDRPGKGKENVVRFKLNANPEWDIKLATGATDLDFDLSKFKIRSVDLAGGAGAFKIKLGDPLAVTKVNIATGASDVDIMIPANAACRITKASAFSSNDFKGFTKVEDNAYETAGFATATNKIYIKIQGGMSSFSVKRY